MAWRKTLSAARSRWSVLSLYQKFEHTVVMLLTGLISVIITFAVWNLLLKVSIIITYADFDPTDYTVFQALFGLIFTVLIALEFKRSLLVTAEQKKNIVQVRTVVLIALLAVVRKLMILDLTHTDATQLLALASTILSLGGVYWLVRDQDRRERGRES